MSERLLRVDDGVEVEAVARIAPEPNGNGEHLVEMLLGGHRHCAWLSGSPRLITALAEVIARDAKVREIVAMADELAPRRDDEDITTADAHALAVVAHAIAALYPEAGK